MAKQRDDCDTVDTFGGVLVYPVGRIDQTCTKVPRRPQVKRDAKYRKRAHSEGKCGINSGVNTPLELAPVYLKSPVSGKLVEYDR